MGARLAGPGQLKLSLADLEPGPDGQGLKAGKIQGDLVAKVTGGEPQGLQALGVHQQNVTLSTFCALVNVSFQSQVRHRHDLVHRPKWTSVSLMELKGCHCPWPGHLCFTSKVLQLPSPLALVPVRSWRKVVWTFPAPSVALHHAV